MAGLVPATHVFRRRERPRGGGEVKNFATIRDTSGTRREGGAGWVARTSPAMVRPLEEQRRSPGGPGEQRLPIALFALAHVRRLCSNRHCGAGRPVIFDRTGHTLSSAVGAQRARSGAGHAAPGQSVKRETAQRYGGRPRHSRTTANRRSRRSSASLGGCFADCGQVTASRSNIGGTVGMKTLTVESGAYLLRLGDEKIIRSAAALSAESRASSCFGWKAFRSADKRT